MTEDDIRRIVVDLSAGRPVYSPQIVTAKVMCGSNPYLRERVAGGVGITPRQLDAVLEKGNSQTVRRFPSRVPHLAHRSDL